MQDGEFPHKAKIPNGLNMYYSKLPSAVAFMFNALWGNIKILLLQSVAPTVIPIKALRAFLRHYYPPPLWGREKFGQRIGAKRGLKIKTTYFIICKSFNFSVARRRFELPTSGL